MKKAVLYDLDGTLVDVSGLYEWVTEKRTDYQIFHDRVEFAPPIDYVVRQAQIDWEAGLEVLIGTARNGRYMAATERWLAKNDVPYSVLAMRGRRDVRSSVEVKSDMLKVLRQEYDIIRAYEDNPMICEMFRTNGILVSTVPGWPDE